MEDRNGLANSIANALLTSKLMNESYTDAAQRILDLSVDYCGKTVWQIIEEAEKEAKNIRMNKAKNLMRANSGMTVGEAIEIVGRW